MCAYVCSREQAHSIVIHQERKNYMYLPCYFSGDIIDGQQNFFFFAVFDFAV